MHVQYHPEAGPGPHDARYLFDRFLELARDPPSNLETVRGWYAQRGRYEGGLEAASR